MAKKVEKEKSFWEKNKTWIVFLIAVGLIVLSVVVSELAMKDAQKEVNAGAVTELSAADFGEKMNASGTNVMYLMSATCSWCSQFKPIIEGVASEYDLTINAIDLSTITTQEAYDAFLAQHSYLGTWSGGTPTTVVMKDGVMVKEQQGYVEEDALLTFFREAGVIE